jgi:GH18 family chitinase
MDVTDIGPPHTHVHFAFGTITPDLQITIDTNMTDQWNRFKQWDSKGIKKIISFGGWAFSNDEPTSNILRTAMLPGNVDSFSTTVANFVSSNGLDGVDFDWEYPGATDIKGSTPGTDQDGPNYLKFVTTLKAKLGGKSLSIAAPASYWYLRGFPIKDMAKTLDYIIYMTYDLHGQWDANNTFSR